MHVDPELDNEPCRETAETIIARAIEHHKRRLIGLEQLIKLARMVPPGSPCEEVLWSVLSNVHNHLFE